MLALLKQLAEVKKLARLGGVAGAEPLPVGTPAPDFEGIDLRSAKTVTKHVFAGKGGVLLFLSPECGSCVGLADGLRQSALSEEDNAPKVAHRTIPPLLPLYLEFLRLQV